MGNFIHDDTVTRLGLTRTPRAPLPLLDVKGIKIGELAYQVKVPLRIGPHEEEIVLDVAPIGNHRLILGLPWLECHDPEIRWSTGHVRFASPYCNVNCMPHPNDVFAKRQPTVTLNYLDIEILATRRTPSARIPTRGSQEAAGWDLYCTNLVTLEPGQ